MGNVGGRPRLAVAGPGRVEDDWHEPTPLVAESPGIDKPNDCHLETLVQEWLLELRMMGRRPRTIEWYRQKMAWYLNTGQAGRLSQLTAYELKRYLGELRARDLADNTIDTFAGANGEESAHTFGTYGYSIRARKPGSSN